MRIIIEFDERSSETVLRFQPRDTEPGSTETETPDATGEVIDAGAPPARLLEAVTRSEREPAPQPGIVITTAGTNGSTEVDIDGGSAPVLEHGPG